MKTFVEKAHELARLAHHGQVDKAGRAYIKHPEAVASFVETDQEKIVAYLHDVIEDTYVTLYDLKLYGFDQEIIDAVDLLTRKPGQSYSNYLKAIKENPLATTVKLADLKHNSDLSRLKTVTKADLRRLEKYQKGIDFLNDR